MALTCLLVLALLLSDVQSKFDKYQKHGLPWGCFHLAIPEHPRYYTNIFSGHDMPCARGTVFSQKACVCVHAPIRVKGCRSAYSLTFSKDEIMFGVPLAYKPHRIKYRDGFGVFNRWSQLKMWRYKGAPYGNEIQLQIRFKDMSDQKIQVLISNCGTRNQPEIPSLLVFIDKTRTVLKRDIIRVLLRTTHNREGVQIVVPYKKDRFNTLVVLYAKNSLNVRVDYEQVSRFKPGGTIIQSKELKGDILKTNHFLRIGTCLNPDGSSQGNGFEGLIDWFDFYPCRP
ncbi:uncharacterized protein LOC121380351 [Gigantopelta aegis]|uniref:uncharacterized protein LOC121380351 n=1 Tax=Gigantopelta aegis TaxID=1735272 RepID=UPI001B88AC10|nr:uncharacterized protein LOC121380351 [Gigantopelta aegis]